MYYIVFQEDIKMYGDTNITAYKVFNEHRREFRIFHFPPLLAKKRKLTEDNTSQLLGQPED